MKFLECVPNISEGRDRAKINKIADAVALIKDLQLLNVSSDPDHHRSVFTFIGSPEGVTAGALACAQKAAELLDLNQHAGVHPRIGVIDVIPFIPVQDTDFEDAWHAAYETGKAIQETLRIPAYYYRGDEVPVPDFMQPFHPLTLPEIRKLAAMDQRCRHSTAGAVAIGVRGFLVAYNVNLVTDNLDAAKRIAMALRTAQSGMLGVRALGLALPSKGCVQVSLNLTQPSITTPAMVFQKIEILAASLGVRVLEAETIGLLPEQVETAAKHVSVDEIPGAHVYCL